MIGSFKSEATENLWLRRKEKSLDPRIWSAALRKLRMLDAAIDVNDLRQPPGNRLEQLAGDRSGEYSIRVNDQWRVVFTWNNGGAHDVEIVDYH